MNFEDQLNQTTRTKQERYADWQTNGIEAATIEGVDRELGSMRPCREVSSIVLVIIREVDKFLETDAYSEKPYTIIPCTRAGKSIICRARGAKDHDLGFNS
jgi:hypothetical protein